MCGIKSVLSTRMSYENALFPVGQVRVCGLVYIGKIKVRCIIDILFIMPKIKCIYIFKKLL